MRDIASFKADLEKWGRKMVLLFPNEAKAGKFARESFPDLPSTIIYGIDTDGIAAQIAESMKLKHKESLVWNELHALHELWIFEGNGLFLQDATK